MSIVHVVCALALQSSLNATNTARVALCCRFVRQDSALWDDLHDGVLTTGIANAALGCAHLNR